MEAFGKILNEFRYRPNLRSAGVTEQAILRESHILLMKTPLHIATREDRACTSSSWLQQVTCDSRMGRKYESCSLFLEGDFHQSLHVNGWSEEKKSFIFDSISDPVALSVVLWCGGTCTRYSLKLGKYTLKSSSWLCKEFLCFYIKVKMYAVYPFCGNIRTISAKI